jgi:hypothetical protein
MMIVINYNGDTTAYDKNAFFQYDYGQKLEIHGATIADGTQFHFAPQGNLAYVALCTTLDGVTTVPVPQKALETSGELNVYVFITTETSGITDKYLSFNVRKREKPGNYAPPDEPYIVEELQAKLDQIIQTGVAEYTPSQAAVEQAVDTYMQNGLITNNLVATVPGTVLDAVQGKALNDAKLDKTGDSKDNTATFTEAVADADIASGETHATLFGKILKSIKTLRTGKINTSDIIQTTATNDTAKVPSSAVTYGIQQSLNKTSVSLTSLASVTTTSRLVCSKKNNRIVASGNLTVNYAGSITDVLSGFTAPSNIIDSIAMAYVGSTPYIARVLILTSGIMQFVIPNLTAATQVVMCFNLSYDLL